MSNDDLLLNEEQKKIIESAVKLMQLDLVDKVLDSAEKLRPLMKDKSINQIDKIMEPVFDQFGITPEMQDDLISHLLDPEAAKKTKIANNAKRASLLSTSPGLQGGQTSVHGGYGKGDYSEEDVRALGLMLFVETSWSRSEIEQSAIIQVAINRAIKWNKSIYQVVKPYTSPAWNNSAAYAARWAKGQKILDTSGDSHTRWLDAQGQIIACLTGNSSVNIGDAMNFLHPNGMSRGNCNPSLHLKNCPASKRICVDYNRVFPKLNAGVRCIPKWAIHVSEGGRSKSRPKLFGKALVCNGSGASAASPLSLKPQRLGDKAGGTYEIPNSGKVRSNSGNEKIIAIGDSITSSWAGGPPTWADQLNIKKYARGAWSSRRIKKRIFYKYLFDKNTKQPLMENPPEKLVILAGLNNHLYPGVVKEDLEEMAEVAQAAGIAVKILTLPPTATYWDKSKRYPDGDAKSLRMISNINQWIKGESWASLPGSGHIDLSGMAGKKGQMKHTNDGIHPNKRGHEEMAIIVRRQLA